MATVLGSDLEGGGRRRKRRPRAVATALGSDLDSGGRRRKPRSRAVAAEIVTESNGGHGAVAVVVTSPESPAEAVVLDRRALNQAEAMIEPLSVPEAELEMLPEAESVSEPVPALEVVPEPPPPDRPSNDAYRNLLGQAVGLRLESVSKVFSTGDSKVAALKDISLEIGPGEFVAIVGPSGCGKTTLLSLMGGLDRPTSGRVFAAGNFLDQISESAMSDYRLQWVGTIFQTFNLVPSMTVSDNVSLPLALAGVDPERRHKRANRLLNLVGLTDRAGTRASRLSGGEQQKVAVARALANRPGLILADEPTGSLDSASGEVVLGLLTDLNRLGATVVLVTHDPEVARRADRVIRMRDGRAIELEGAGHRNVRNQDAVSPPRRLHWRDTLQLGLGSTGRRPLRTALTTSGVAIGIAAMSLIVALAAGLQSALAGPALVNSPLHQVAVHVAPGVSAKPLDASALTTLAGAPHVSAAWGEVVLSGAFTLAPSTNLAPRGALLSLPPRGTDASPTLLAGRMPISDAAAEILIGDSEARALGLTTPADALGKKIGFIPAFGSMSPGQNAVAQPSTKALTIVGVVADDAIAADGGGALAPYKFMTTYWAGLAKANGWTGNEFRKVTLLADSAAGVDAIRDEVRAAGFTAQTFGDPFRALEQLTGRLRLALLGLALVALILAGLGIANTMYTAVLERTKEIGVLKAVGARRRDVMLLFVAEAVVIGLAGGVLGTFLAAALARAGNAEINRLTHAVAGGLDVFRLDVLVVILAILGSMALSTLSGLLPAMRAAIQDPVSALHAD